MKYCWLIPLGGVLTLAACLRGAALPVERKAACACLAPAREQVGYLLASSPETGEVKAVPYYPRAGDMLFFDEYNKFHHFVYHLVGTGPPTHSAIVFEQDGKPKILDLTGPTVARARVVILDVSPRLQGFRGAIMVRRTREPLAADQNIQLAQFAESEQGKAFALPRIILQATPFCARTGLRHRCFGHTYRTRNRWFCSELVVSGAATAHLLDPHVYRANAIYPRDLAYDENVNLSNLYEQTLVWAPGAPSNVPTATPEAPGPIVPASAVPSPESTYRFVDPLKP